ncbi:MAG: hypothetical protein ACYC18_09605 [Gammaproteobacteria bacterium]
MNNVTTSAWLAHVQPLRSYPFTVPVHAPVVDEQAVAIAFQELFTKNFGWAH